MSELLATLRPGVSVVALTEFQGQMLLATSDGIYIMKDGAFHPVPFVMEADGPHVVVFGSHTVDKGDLRDLWTLDNPSARA